MKNKQEASTVVVYFGKQKVARHQLPESGVVISPGADSWNDFSLRTRFGYEIVERGETLLKGWLHLAFTDSSVSSAERVRDLLRASPEPLRRSTDFPEFFTLQPSMQAYRSMVQCLQASKARTYLRAINDMVVAQRRKRKPGWFSKAQESLAFRRSFMRNSEAFFAFHNAVSILSGLRGEELSGLSQELRLKFKLPSFENHHELHFSFAEEEIPPRRIAVVIGENGTGKSRALHNLVASALANDRRLRTTAGERPILNRLLAIESPGETHSTFPVEKAESNSRVAYIRIALDRRAQRGAMRGLTNLFVRLARSEDRIGDRTRWRLFEKAVSGLIPWDEIWVRLRRTKLVDDASDQVPSGPSWIPLSRLGYGGERDQLDLWARVDPSTEPRREAGEQFVPFSSGQISFIRFAAQLCLNMENGTLLLMDEPETHLHPSLITDFVALLSGLLKTTGSFAVLSTHSSYFVRETPSSQVLVLREVEPRRIEVSRPRLRTLGADVGAISRFVFGDRTPSLVLTELRSALANNPRDRAHALGLLREVLPLEAQMYLERGSEAARSGE